MFVLAAAVWKGRFCICRKIKIYQNYRETLIWHFAKIKHVRLL